LAALLRFSSRSDTPVRRISRHWAWASRVAFVMAAIVTYNQWVELQTRERE